MTISELNKEIGNIDIYLLDLILKGRVTQDMKILDAGCGEGRNLTYFINNGYDVHGVDSNPTAIKMLQLIAKDYEKERFVVSNIENMIYPPNIFDLVISSAVLHFAEDDDHFHQMMNKLVSVLKPGGILFIRMTTEIGLNGLNDELKNGRYKLPDGSERYLLRTEVLESFLIKYHLKNLEHPKSVVVINQRSMGVFVLQKLQVG